MEKNTIERDDYVCFGVMEPYPYLKMFCFGGIIALACVLFEKEFL